MTNLDNLCIMTGNANPELAKKIASHIGVPLCDAYVGHFNNGETQVMISESIRGKDIFIIQPTSQPVNDNLMELLIMTDACKRASAHSITAVVPYYAYARQDRMGTGGVDFFCTKLCKCLRPLAKRACRVDDVVDEDCRLALDFADEVHDLRHARLRAALLDDGDRCVQAVGKISRARDAAEIG